MSASGHGSCYLGVEKSALGRRWRERLDQEGQGRAQMLAQQQGHPDLLARVLAGRGVGVDEADRYLDPTVRAMMPDPDVLQDMAPAVARLVAAAEGSETVAVFGDYDVDGACSAALVADYLEACGAPCLVHIPDRVFEGYGPNVEAVRALRERGASLLVAVDCGTTSFEALEEARRLGLDALVLDHHQAPETLPPALALVNPNRQDDLSGLGHLCAAGVCFMVLVALNRALRERGFWRGGRAAPDLLGELDLVALATVADVVPLVGLNRAFVAKGLAVMKGRGRPGLRALLDIAGEAGPPRPFTLGFMIGPRINAGGRIGDAALGTKLLRTRDEAEAGRIAAELDRLNRERRASEQAATAEAYAQALASIGLTEKGAVALVGSEAWRPGIVGLIAARLKERFGKPAFAIAFAGEIGTGSGRSIVGVDLGRAVREAVARGLLVKGGGHAMAAGVTISRPQLGPFQAFLEDSLGEAVRASRGEDSLLIDASLTAAGARPELILSLERAGPFGSANPEPIFVFPEHRVLEATPVGQDHLRVRAAAGDGSRLDGIAFRAAGSPLGAALLEARGGAAVHLAGHLTLD
ncbi:MAG TPA: single-stranded-DNA-specific exonuclease RecJ, partial [Beijerinckiaceae bacterium]|nr:single-stranded-DNA-specific exonuclease RecJ [Beijerinckiaceae bacterium]